MSYQSRHRRPRWHDPLLSAVTALLNLVARAVAWPLDRIAGWLAGDAWDDEDDGECVCGEINSRHCPVHNDVPRPAASTGPFNADAEPGPGHHRVIHAVPIGDGDDFEPLTGRREPWPVNPWINCAFAPEPRTGRLPSAGELDPDAPWCPGCGFANYSSGPCEVCGYNDQNVPWPGDDSPPPGPGHDHQSVFGAVPFGDPGYLPRTLPRERSLDDTVIEAAPRIAAGRITAVTAGAW